MADVDMTEARAAPMADATSAEPMAEATPGAEPMAEATPEAMNAWSKTDEEVTKDKIVVIERRTMCENMLTHEALRMIINSFEEWDPTRDKTWLRRNSVLLLLLVLVLLLLLRLLLALIHLPIFSEDGEGLSDLLGEIHRDEVRAPVPRCVPANP